MQKPIRYYITTSGEEPTVRSVQVALGERDSVAGSEPAMTPSDRTRTARQASTRTTEVKRRFKEAIRGRIDDPS